MVRFHPEPQVSNSSFRPSASPSSARQNNLLGRPQRIGHHHRTASANTRDLLHRPLNHNQPRQIQTLRSVSSSSLSGLDYAATGSSPQRNQYQQQNFIAQRADPLTLRQFAERELAVVVLWRLASFAASFVSPSPLERNHIVASFVPYFLTMVQRRTSVLPFWPGRLAEYAMGRLSKQEAIVSLSVHAAVFALSLVLVVSVVPERFVEPAAGVSSSQEDRHDPEVWNYIASLPWMLLRFLPTLIRESVSTAALVVSLLVLPTVLDLNRFPPWSMVILYYPWGSGILLRCFQAPATINFSMSLHWVSEALGAVLAGEVMDMYFPDDSPSKSSAIERS
jgi:hypothetical protein